MFIVARVSLWVLVWRCVAVSGGIDGLDPATYQEPNEGKHWAGTWDAQTPFPIKHFQDLSRKEFDGLIQDGQIFVVHNISSTWAMKNWTCDFFQRDAELMQAEMQQQYAAGGGAPFVGFKSDWDKAKTPSGAKDPNAPQLAPFYWGIKDVQYADAHRSKTWRKSMLKRVQKSFKLPEFMDTRNAAEFGRTPEFWFAPGGAGAKAHMDTHVQSTISVQLAGSKRWRLRPLESRDAPYLAMVYKDGDVYEKSGSWAPLFTINLEPGDALFFPPGVIHETLTLSEECASSVTFQFAKPWASRYYRKFFPRIRRTADIHESWPIIETWATLGQTSPKLHSGLPHEEAKKLAPELFATLDEDRDGFLTFAEIEKKLRGDANAALGWHDLDEDGTVSAAEYAEGFSFWAAITHVVIRDTPKEWQKYQLTDMQGDFNIEDLRGTVTKKMQKWAEGFEKNVRKAKNVAAEL